MFKEDFDKLQVEPAVVWEDVLITRVIRYCQTICLCPMLYHDICWWMKENHEPKLLANPSFVEQWQLWHHVCSRFNNMVDEYIDHECVLFIIRLIVWLPLLQCIKVNFAECVKKHLCHWK